MKPADSSRVIVGILIAGVLSVTGSSLCRPAFSSHGGIAQEESRLSRTKASADAMEEFSGLKKEARDAVLKGDFLLSQGKTEEALRAFQLALRENPDHWVVHDRLGRVQERMGRFDEALQEYRNSVSIQETAINQLDLSGLYRLTGDNAKALAYARRAAGLDPASWTVQDNLGQCYLNLRRYDEAVDAYRKAISEAENPLTRMSLGWAYIGKTNYPEAIRSFQRAVELAPGLAGLASQGLGRAYYKSEQYDQAIALLTKAVEQAPSEEGKQDLEFDLAYCHVAKGEYERAYYLLGKRSSLGVSFDRGDQGILIYDVYKNGPADLAGIREGDMLVEFDGEPLAGMNRRQFGDMVSKAAFGGKVKVKVFKDGQYSTKYVVMGVSPDLPRSALEAEDGKASPGAVSTMPSQREGVPPALPGAQAPALQIQDAAVVPSPVPAGGDFEVRISLAAASSGGRFERIPVVMTYAISRGGNLLAESPPQTIEVPGGQVLVVTKKLTATREEGLYTIVFKFSHKDAAVQRSIDFAVQQGSQAQPRIRF